jgi:hypothetical protein
LDAGRPASASTLNNRSNSWHLPAAAARGQPGHAQRFRVRAGDRAIRRVSEAIKPKTAANVEYTGPQSAILVDTLKCGSSHCSCWL